MLQNAQENLDAPKPPPGCRSHQPTPLSAPSKFPVRETRAGRARGCWEEHPEELEGTGSLSLSHRDVSYLVVGDLFLRSQCTASKKAAFQNRRLCLQGRREMLGIGIL